MSAQPSHSINAVFVNAFLEATIEVLETMAETVSTPGRPYIKTSDNSRGDISGIIGMAGPGGLQGAFAISFGRATALGIAGQMLCEPFTMLSDDVIDTVGELTNIISGAARAKLSETGREYGMATPSVVVAPDHTVTQMTTEAIVVMPFTTTYGPFLVELSLFRVGN